MTRVSPSLAVVAVVLSSVLLAACSSSPDAAPSASDIPSQSIPAATPSSAPGIPAGASPLSGLPGGADKPVLVVKIDNTGWSQPHEGLTAADLVYIEPVEWGLNRLAAVFATTIPTSIGPVRSARITDIELLAQYGRPAFAYSGAQSKLLPELRAAPFFDVSGLRDGEGYRYDPDRRSPYNALVDGTVLLAQRAPEASLATDMGFVFSEQPPAGGAPADEIAVKWYDSRVAFHWDAAASSYQVYFNDKPARAVESPDGQRAATVVIQSVSVDDSGYRDRYGGKTPYPRTVGSGRALVARDGRVWEATWSRPDAASGTTFALADGTRIPFDVGQEWIVLYDEDKQAVVRP